MAVLLGEALLRKDAQGRLVSHLGVVFPFDRVVLTGRTTHAELRLAYLDHLAGRPAGAPRPPLSAADQFRLEQAVDFNQTHDTVFIRPERSQLELSFAADEVLQELVRKEDIRFLGFLDRDIRQALKERGELWRIATLPRTSVELQQWILGAKKAIGTRPMYYYGMEQGTRYLTYAEFAQLGQLAPEELAACLNEIKKYSANRNKKGNLEVDFFMTGDNFCAATFAPLTFSPAPPEELRRQYAALKEQFLRAVPSEYQADNADDPEWRQAMATALLGRDLEAATEEALLGLGREFHLHVRWLPGARIENGEVIYDSIFSRVDPPSQADLCDELVRSIIFNIQREFAFKTEYLNVGRVEEPLGGRPPELGRRRVYCVELKLPGRERELVRMIRFQKWDVREHILQGKPLLQAMQEAEEYTEYVLDRILGCGQLGMNLMPYAMAKGSEHWEGRLLRPTYFERDYVYGFSTNRIPSSFYQTPSFPLELARLLGEAAASDAIVGRGRQTNGKLYFDDGDEVLQLDEAGRPARIIVADSTGSFTDYESPLTHYSRDYAQPVLRRRSMVLRADLFAEVYVEAFVERFQKIQDNYRRRKIGYRTMFNFRRCEPATFAFRWLRILERLEATHAVALGEEIRRQIERAPAQTQILSAHDGPRTATASA